MIVKVVPHPDQIRWYAHSALNGFKTLDPEDAIANAKGDMEALLAYLDRVNDAKRVLGVVPVEPRVRDERNGGQVEIGNKPDLKIVRP